MHDTRPRLHFILFMQKQFGNVLLLPTTSTGTVPYPASNDDNFI